VLVRFNMPPLTLPVRLLASDHPSVFEVKFQAVVCANVICMHEMLIRNV